MKLVDIGANLTHQSFAHDFDEVIANAEDAGVAHIILTGTDLETSIEAQRLAAQRSQLFSATAGFHPHVASSCGDQELQQIQQLATTSELVAIGETGLDFNRNFSPREQQLRVFEQHLELAVDVQKPLFLHQRNAHDDFIALLTKYRSQVCGGVVHCFTDTEEALREYLELDMYIGITGWICDERRGKELQQIVSIIPEDRLLIETDAPYLLPRSLSPKPKTRRNEPKYLAEVLGVIAQHCDRDFDQLAIETTRNAKRLFGLTTAGL